MCGNHATTVGKKIENRWEYLDGKGNQKPWVALFPRKTFKAEAQ
jgi:hypothetical protein